MFKRAKSLLDEREKIFSEEEVHVVSFRWDNYIPQLKVYNGKRVEELDLGKIDINVSEEKICVGSFENGYEPCLDKRHVDKFRQCRRCAPDSIPRLDCVFEPGDCEGCEGGFCEEEHAVYLAFHGKHPKIGMTRKERLKTRMIEQGADAYALLSTVGHRVRAREEEKELSSRLNISQSVGANKILKQMSRKLDKGLIRTKYRGVRNRIAIGDLKFLNGYPITEPLRAVPRLRAAPGPHKGEMVGIKGKFLIYENNGLQALDISDLPGRKMMVRTLQGE